MTNAEHNFIRFGRNRCLNLNGNEALFSLFLAFFWQLPQARNQSVYRVIPASTTYACESRNYNVFLTSLARRYMKRYRMCSPALLYYTYACESEWWMGVASYIRYHCMQSTDRYTVRKYR